ncbi:MAG: rRNA methyltransferase [Alphaproteobacteria bacterium]|nr:rRNA methyltransferase [Alphaproteobacteria bacterium]
MEMPAVLKQNLERLMIGTKQDCLKKSAARLSLRYRTEKRQGQSLIGNEIDSVSYAVSRMPATFGAFSVVLKQAADLPNFSPKTMCDIGSGTGSAVWVAACFFHQLSDISGLERSADMRSTAKRLTETVPDFFPTRPDWRSFDLTADTVPQANLITAGYVLNELDPSMRTKALIKLWTAVQGVLVLIEPGTPESFCQMKAFRQTLIENGAFIAAPCPHQNACLNDWCHFGCRIARSKLHRETKGGEAPFEDEKFCYLIACRQSYPTVTPRVLRRPLIEKGKVTLSLCAPEGIAEKTFSKKDGPAYKAARKVKWAEAFIQDQTN